MGKYAANKRECDIVADYLKQRNLEAQLKDIIFATSSLIAWPRNPTEKMNSFLRFDERITRARQGYYRYQNPEQEREQEKEIKPVPVKPSRPSAVATPPSVVVIPRDNGGALQVRMGDVVHGMVTGLHDYGVFVDIPEHTISGLIHKSNVKNGKMFFSRGDLERHFRYGDWVNATVVSFRKNGRLALSTADFDLPDYSKGSPIAQQLEKLALNMAEKKDTVLAPPEAVPTPVTPAKPIIRTKTEEAPQMVKTTATSNTSSSVTNMKDELDELYEMVRKKVGVISLNSKEALKETVRQNGLVRVTMALMMANDFEADVSLAFVRHIEQKVNGGL